MRLYSSEDVRRALIAKDISAIAGPGATGAFADLAPTVLAAIRLADLTAAPFVAIDSGRNLYALHDVADAANVPGSAVLIIGTRPDVDAYLRAAS